MPIIFASTVLTFLTIFVGYIVNLDIFPKLDFAPNIQPLIYSMTNFGLILAFSLFYSNLILNPS